MTLQEFIGVYQGKSNDFDGVYGPQCVDLIQFYARSLGLPTFWGNAKDIINQASEAWTRVSAWQPGDVVVFSPSAANDYYGHVGIAVDGWQVFEQNYGSDKSEVHRRYWQRDAILGFLRPKNLTEGGSLPYSDQAYNQVTAEREDLRNRWWQSNYKLAGVIYDACDVDYTDADLRQWINYTDGVDKMTQAIIADAKAKGGKDPQFGGGATPDILTPEEVKTVETNFINRLLASIAEWLNSKRSK